MIRTLRKRQKKTNYTIEIKRRSTVEKMEDYLDDDMVEATDDKNTQSPRKDNTVLHDNKVSDTIYKAGDAAPDKASNNVGDRNKMLNQLKEKTVARKMKLENLRQQH